MISPADRIRGCFLGGAVGDALGAPLEFMRLDEIRRIFGVSGAEGYWDQATSPGAFTDDTQMTLFTAEGLIRASQRMNDRGIVDAVSVVWGAYLRWLDTQGQRPVSDPGLSSSRGYLVDLPELRRTMAPGNTCLSALRSGVMGTMGTSLNDSKGCGGVMRVAPVGFVAGDPFELACKLAAITHSHPTGFFAAGALALIVHQTSTGADLGLAVEQTLDRLEQEPRGEEVSRALKSAVYLSTAATPPTPEIVESLGAGWIAEEALAISVYCSMAASSFREGVLLAVNHSGDSDSTGSITGQILGTANGEDSIPRDWIAGLQARAVVEKVALDFASRLLDGQVLDYSDYPPN